MFREFLSACWDDHAADAEDVFRRLPEGLALVTEPAHLPQLAGLAVHVAAEHLGRYDDGLALLDRIEASPLHDPASDLGKATRRSRAALLRCAGRQAESEAVLADALDSARPPGSSRARVLAVVASALAGQGRVAEAGATLDEAVAALGEAPDPADPAARSLAITGNNLACALEEKVARTAAETELMKRAAHLGRTWWEVAGTWHNVMLAEVRLGFTHLAAGEPEEALGHGLAGLQIADANGGAPDDRLAPLCVVAKARAAAGHPEAPGAVADARACLTTASVPLQAWYAPVLDGL